LYLRIKEETNEEGDKYVDSLEANIA